eukprot:scaffold548626_cov47-Prasinocladus_malaysianus.AAC.1
MLVARRGVREETVTSEGPLEDSIDSKDTSRRNTGGGWKARAGVLVLATAALLFVLWGALTAGVKEYCRGTPAAC